MFARWGRLVYRRRLPILIVSLLVLAGSLVPVLGGGVLNGGGVSRGQAHDASALIGAQLPHSTGSSFSIVFSSHSLRVSDPRFHAAFDAALRPLGRDSRVTGITTPYNVPGVAATALRSRDGKSALAMVQVKDSQGVARRYYPALARMVHSPTLQATETGQLAPTYDFDHYLGRDLRRAELVSFPAALLLLLLVFGTVVAALLPLGVGGLAVVGGLGGVYLLNRATDVSQYALNIVTLIGLGVAIDYSLFIVNRFREELAGGASVEDALAIAMATAGRAIAFSGLTVAIGLSGMLFYQGTFLASMGLAGAISVACAVFYALTFLPATLALLGRRVDRLRLPLARRRAGRSLWRGIAETVMRRPVVILAVTVPLLLAAGSPFLQLRLANTDVAALPPQAASYRGYQEITTRFPGQNETAISVVVQYPSGRPLTASRVGALYDLTNKIERLPGVSRVEGIVSLDPRYGKRAYQRLYARPPAAWPSEVRAAARATVGRNIVLLTAMTPRAADGDAARSLVTSIRGLHLSGDGRLLVTGQTALDIDAVNLLLSDTPAALAYVIVATCVVLFLLLGSVVLPIKAVLTDMLSITASFGALVWIFQQGHLSHALNFNPAPLDPTVPVLLFCIVFGLSMDYEVLLLSRIKEAYDRGMDNREAVAEGLERSGRLITGAAAIMVAVFVAFAMADVSLIKSIGLGMAVAVAVDATLVRALIVPAAMRLLGDFNWWAPRPLARLYQRLNLGETLTETHRAA